MIYDSLENLGRYRCLGESFARAVDALEARDLFSLADGRYEIDEKNYFSVSQPALKPREGSRYEAHRLYADIQIALTEGETIDVAPVAALGDWDEYDPQNDIVFTGDTAPASSSRCTRTRLPFSSPGTRISRASARERRRKSS